MEPTATETTGDGESGIIHIASLYTKDSSAEPQNLGGVVTSRRAKEVVPAAVPPEPLLDLTAHLHNARTDGRLLGWMDGQAGAIDLADMVTIAAIESSRRALPDAVLKGRLREATWDRISPHLLQDTPLIAFRVMALAFEPADPSLTEVPGRASEDCFEWDSRLSSFALIGKRLTGRSLSPPRPTAYRNPSALEAPPLDDLELIVDRIRDADVGVFISPALYADTAPLRHMIDEHGTSALDEIVNLVLRKVVNGGGRVNS